MCEARGHTLVCSLSKRSGLYSVHCGDPFKTLKSSNLIGLAFNTGPCGGRMRHGCAGCGVAGPTVRALGKK